MTDGGPASQSAQCNYAGWWNYLGASPPEPPAFCSLRSQNGLPPRLASTPLRGAPAQGGLACARARLRARKGDSLQLSCDFQIHEYTMNKIDQSASIQQFLCARLKANYCPSPDNLKVGIALETFHLRPLNGLRHPVQDDTTGWYIWDGESLSTEPDFFSSLHLSHLVEKCPAAMKYLGLPPGYRFLVDGKHQDIWFDDSLLHVIDK